MAQFQPLCRHAAVLPAENGSALQQGAHLQTTVQGGDAPVAPHAAMKLFLTGRRQGKQHRGPDGGVAKMVPVVTDVFADDAKDVAV